GVGGQARLEHLDGDQAVHAQLPGLVHRAHRAVAEFLQELVAGDLLPQEHGQFQGRAAGLAGGEQAGVHEADEQSLGARLAVGGRRALLHFLARDEAAADERVRQPLFVEVGRAGLGLGNEGHECGVPPRVRRGTGCSCFLRPGPRARQQDSAEQSLTSGAPGLRPVGVPAPSGYTGPPVARAVSPEVAVLVRAFVAALSALALAALPATPQETRQATGANVGAVTDTAAIVWARLTAKAGRNDAGVLRKGPIMLAPAKKADPKTFEGACPGAPGQIRLRYGTRADLGDAKATSWADVTEKTDFSHQFRLTALKPATVYHYAVDTAGPRG